MSRIGRRPLEIKEKVDVDLQKNLISVSGPKGKLIVPIHPLVEVEREGSNLVIKADYLNNRDARAQMGTMYSLIRGMIQGVSSGFQKQLNLVGVGYKAALSGQKLELNLGYSHPINFELPEIVSAKILSNTQILLESCDKQALGQTAAKIKSFRPPEPYKGKGILFANEKILRKAGKSGKK